MALTDAQIEPLFDELRRYTAAGGRRVFDDVDRQVYGNAARHYCHGPADVLALISEIRAQNGNGRGGRPSARDVEAMARDVLGVEETPSYIKPLEELREGWRRDSELAALLDGDDDSAPEGMTPRDRARAKIRALLERTTTPSGDRTYSYTPDEFRPAYTGDADPMYSVPEEAQFGLLMEAAAMMETLVRSPHPRLVRDLAAKLYHDRNGAIRHIADERKKYIAVLGTTPTGRPHPKIVAMLETIPPRPEPEPVVVATNVTDENEDVPAYMLGLGKMNEGDDEEWAP